MRVYRHSDNFGVSSTSLCALDKEVTLIQQHIGTNGFEPESQFLGIEIRSSLCMVCLTKKGLKPR